MKPDDILNAIGDVEEKLVKKAHRKELLKALLVFAVCAAVMMYGVSLLLEPDYLLSRITPDFQVNTGYIDPAALEDDGWTSMTYTGYAGGQETEKTEFRRMLFGDWRITHTTGSGAEQVLIGTTWGEYYRREYAGQSGEENLYLEARYDKDIIGRVDAVTIQGKQANERGEVLLNMLTMEYTDNHFLIRQSQVRGNQVQAYQALSYVDHRLFRTRDYDAAGNVLGYTEYSYADTARTGKSYDAQGTLTGSTVSSYDWLGRVRERSHFDASGNCTGTEVYHYRVWELFRSIEGLLVLIPILSLSATLAVAVYEDRRPFSLGRDKKPTE